jgi:hypothetical protein
MLCGGRSCKVCGCVREFDIVALKEADVKGKTY